MCTRGHRRRTSDIRGSSRSPTCGPIGSERNRPFAGKLRGHVGLVLPVARRSETGEYCGLAGRFLPPVRSARTKRDQDDGLQGGPGDDYFDPR